PFDTRLRRVELAPGSRSAVSSSTCSRRALPDAEPNALARHRAAAGQDGAARGAVDALRASGEGARVVATRQARRPDAAGGQGVARQGAARGRARVVVAAREAGGDRGEGQDGGGAQTHHARGSYTLPRGASAGAGERERLGLVTNRRVRDTR